METKECTSVELKTSLDKVYEDSISSICKMVERIGRDSYSINGYWMSSEVSLFLDSNYIGPYLLHISRIENSFQIIKIGKYRNGSGASFEIRLYYDSSSYIVLPKTMNVKDFPYRSRIDFLPTITILRSLEYLESSLS